MITWDNALLYQITVLNPRRIIPQFFCVLFIIRTIPDAIVLSVINPYYQHGFKTRPGPAIPGLPNLAYHLFSEIKFYWNMAVSIWLLSLSIGEDLSNYNRDCMTFKGKTLTLWLFIEKFCWSFLYTVNKTINQLLINFIYSSIYLPCKINFHVWIQSSWLLLRYQGDVTNGSWEEMHFSSSLDSISTINDNRYNSKM